MNFLSADLTWFDIYYPWLSHLNPWLHSGETRYNLDSWCFWHLYFLKLLIKCKHRWLQVS